MKKESETKVIVKRMVNRENQDTREVERKEIGGNEYVEKEVEEKRNVERKEEEHNKDRVHLNGGYHREFQKEMIENK